MPVAHPLGKLEMMAVARRKVGAGLGDADDRLAGLQLLAGQAVVQVALEIERGHAWIFGIVEPQFRPQPHLVLGHSVFPLSPLAGPPDEPIAAIIAAQRLSMFLTVRSPLPKRKRTMKVVDSRRSATPVAPACNRTLPSRPGARFAQRQPAAKVAPCRIERLDFCVGKRIMIHCNKAIVVRHVSFRQESSGPSAAAIS